MSLLRIIRGIICLVVMATTLSLQASEQATWSYAGETGPDRWAEVEKHSSCGGMSQSPVNIVKADTDPDRHDEWSLSLDYQDGVMVNQSINNGHTVQYDFDAGNVAVFGDTRYSLVQVHFHAPSEHTINGMRYPIEMHFVHLNEDKKEYVVLGVLGYQGRPTESLNFVERYIPEVVGSQMTLAQSVDFSRLFPLGLTPRFHYRGSLTTPPCTESVNWVLFELPVEISTQALQKIEAAMPIDNYRDAQSLNGRKVHWVVN